MNTKSPEHERIDPASILRIDIRRCSSDSRWLVYVDVGEVRPLVVEFTSRHAAIAFYKSLWKRRAEALENVV